LGRTYLWHRCHSAELRFAFSDCANADFIGAAGEEAAARQTAYLREQLQALSARGALPSAADGGFITPLDPHYRAAGVLVERCRVIGSAQKPIWLELKNADPFGAPLRLIFKTGDDLRQDMLTLQVSWALPA
jgi:hypothetical protein